MSRISFIAFISVFILNVSAQRQMENLGRGIVAIRTSSNQVFISWRMLATESEDIVFNLYRDTILLTSTPETNYVDTTRLNSTYYIRPVINKEEQEASMRTGVQTQPYYSIPLQPLEGYYVHFVWVGDLDGDGEYDYVVDRHGAESSKLEAYRRDGTFLWRYDCGPNGLNKDNIAPGSSAISIGHADDVTVYDLDSDGQAEVIVKTANGVIFGDGTILEHNNDNEQFISVLNGATGAEEARAPVPTDYIDVGPVQGHFGIMYCDSVNPSFVFKAKNRRADGGFNLLIVTYDYKNGELIQRWKWNRGNTNAPDAHQIRIIDLDGDGRDEISNGGHVIDDDGTFLYTIPGVVHGDRFHITDFDPERPGLEGYYIQQDNPSGLAWVYFDAADGSIIRQQVLDSPADLARGTAGDIDPRYKGLEFWTFTDGIYTAQSEDPISINFPWPNFKIWWDGDVMAELLNTENITKWNYLTESESYLLNAGKYGAVDSWRDAAQFHGDIMGDWREEVIFGSEDNSAILIFTTTHPTDTRLYTLPHNPGYRACMTVKGYQQSHLTDYYLGDGMSDPPAPYITLIVDTSTHKNLPPFRPQNLAAIPNYDTVKLTWSESIDLGIMGYNIYRSDSVNDNYLKLNDTLLTETNYQDTSVVYETTYYYTVTVISSDTIESYPSAEVLAIPTLYPYPPDRLNVRDNEDSVIISWKIDEVANIIGYNIYRTQTPGNSYIKINADIVQDSTYLDLDIENGKMYYYVITSINDLELESSYSGELLAMPGKKDIYEAENADFGNGSTHDSNHDGFYGTGFINFPSNGGYVEFTNIPGGEGGDYTVRYRYALGNNDRSGNLEYNGTVKGITMQGTGDWANWNMTDVAVTLLPNSENIIRFESTGSDFGNLDRIIILPYKTIEETPVITVFDSPEELHLKNYPNPFNAETNILYDLPKSGYVYVRVFDMYGHSVTVLVKQYQEAGSHKVPWNGKDSTGNFVDSGIYFYELITENFRIVKKMILVE